MMTARVLTAIDFAIRKHDGQWRKGDDGPPYVVHCIDVARRVAEATFAGDDTLCAAILDLVKYPPKRWSPKSMLGYLDSSIRVVEAARMHTRSHSVRKMADMFSEHVGPVRQALEAKR